MLKHRIIAKLLLEDGVLVKYKRFTENKRIVGDPSSIMGIMEDQILDEFYICDLGSAHEHIDTIASMTRNVFCPVTIGGSIKSLDQAADLFRYAGADKVVVRDPNIADDIAMKYGRQSIVCPIDYHGDGAFFDVPECYGEVILTSIDRDGTGTGFDIGAVRFPYSIPTILAGGCGKLSHVKDAFKYTLAVAISSMFAFTDKSPVKLRSWLRSEGVNVRAAV